MKRLFIDLHAIQSVPPSNINRDDTGSPKTAQYGGVTRSRVSSQSWKKAIRDYFNQKGVLTNEGVRSLNVIEYVARKIQELDESVSTEEALKMSEKAFNDAGVKTANNKVKALFFISRKQAENLARAALDRIDKKKDLQKILNNDIAVDLALFGRMVADDPSLNEDASAQVAHAISTHAVQTEFDFFTATDDLAPEDNAGAGMLGTVEYNSSTLYRYANINIHELKNQLSEEVEVVIDSICLFVEAFANSMPTGKINTFANQTLPDALLITGRVDRPVNLVTAFEKPVRSSEGFVDTSIKNLSKEFEKVLSFVDEPVFTLSIGFDSLGENQKSIKTLNERLKELLKQQLINL